MARENTVLMNGQLYNKPKIFCTGTGEAVQASFYLKVMRRPFLTGEGQTTLGQVRVDIVPIVTRNKELIDKCIELRQGDMVELKGVIVSRNVRKESICPEGHKMSTIGTNIFITPIHLERKEKALTDEQGNELLRERCEISNIVMVIGSLCNEPQFYEYEDREGACVAQYQIAAPRRYHLRDGHESETVDFLWIRTVGRQAREDIKHLRKGATIFTNASVQSRNISRKIQCPECGQVFQQREMVCELFPYAVEYLRGCIFDGLSEPMEDDGFDTITAQLSDDDLREIIGGLSGEDLRKIARRISGDILQKYANGLPGGGNKQGNE